MRILSTIKKTISHANIYATKPTKSKSTLDPRYSSTNLGGLLDLKPDVDAS